MKYLQLLMERFWNRCKTEYLTQLREFQKMGKGVEQISIGEVVLIHDHNTKRNKLKLGKVVELLSGKDTIPRAAVVKMIIKNDIYNIRRLITKLDHSEIPASLGVSDQERAMTLLENDQTYDDVGHRPQRTSAEIGILLRRLKEH